MEKFESKILLHCLLPATESVVVLLDGGVWGGGGCLNEEYWRRKKSDRRVDNTETENKATVTDRWARWEKLKHCNSLQI